MDRQRRSSQEDQIWGNPCDIDGPVAPVKYTKLIASKVAKQASSAIRDMSSYQDQFALTLHDIDKFSNLLEVWQSYEWMHSWLREPSAFIEDVMPSSKMYGSKISETETENILSNIDDVLPAMYKGLKAVVASMFTVSGELPQTGPNLTNELRDKLVNSSHKLRLVLCEFDELMRARNLEIVPLLNDEIPEYSKSTRIQDVTLVYRDAVNYLEFLMQIFEKMAKDS